MGSRRDIPLKGEEQKVLMSVVFLFKQLQGALTQSANREILPEMQTVRTGELAQLAKWSPCKQEDLRSIPTFTQEGTLWYMLAIPGLRR